MNLRNLSVEKLDNDTLMAVKNEFAATKVVVHHFRESDFKKRYSAKKFSSMHKYAEGLGYGAGSADRRIKAARLLEDLPEIIPKLENDVHSITNLAHAQKYFKDSGIKNNQEKQKILSMLENKTEKETIQLLFAITPEDKRKKGKESQKQINEHEYELTMIVNASTIEKIKKMRSLKNKDLSMGELFELGLDLAIKESEDKKFCKLKRSTETPVPENSQPAATKAIPSAVKRAVSKRDGYKCVNCGSKEHLHYNHIVPRAYGGTNNVDNINLLCFNCNQLQRVEDGLGGYKYQRF